MVMLLAQPHGHHFSGHEPFMSALSPSLPGRELGSPGHHGLRKRSKLEVCEALVQRLREQGSVDLDDFAFVESLHQHFRSLPTRYALDVNINSLDVLNHKRLLDSARADPSALSFQVRPVDVISAAGTSLHSSRRPSFTGSDTPLQEVGGQQRCCVLFHEWAAES